MNAVLTAPRTLLWNSDETIDERAIGDEFSLLLRSVFDLHVRRDQHFPATSTTDFDAAASKVLRAPRTIRRLLWPSPERTTTTTAFLEHALAIELRLAAPEHTADDDSAVTGWSADGRAHIGTDGGVLAQASVPGFDAVIDLASPHARTLDLSGGPIPLATPRPEVSPSVADATVAAITAAWHLVEAVGPPTAERLQRWITVVVAQLDPSDTFWSGSNGHYIGRAALTNPAGVRVSTYEVADALVHEGIHGLLAQHETLQPWVHDPALFTSHPAIRSPWTRNMLPVRPYLQACFVWYGLAMFWANAVGRANVDHDEVRRLFGRAVSGFVGVDLVVELHPWSATIDANILRVIGEMQTVVRDLVQ